MPQQGFSKSARLNGVKGVSYRMDQEEGVFSFAADTGENSNVWFKKYSTPSAFEAEETKFGSSWSWMGSPGAMESPNNGSLNPEVGGKISVHPVADGTTTYSFSFGSNVKGVTAVDDKVYVVFDVNNEIRVFDFETKSKVNTITGSAIDNTPIGLTFDGTYLWHNDSGTIQQHTLDGSSNISSFSSGGGWGVTWNGSYFYTTSRSGDTVYEVKTDGTRTNTFDLSGDLTRPTGVTWDGKYFWVGDDSVQAVYQFTSDFTKVGSFNSPENAQSGVGFDGRYYYTTDTNSGSQSVAQVTNSASLDVSYRVNSIV